MGLPDFFMPMVRPIPRIGVMGDDLCKRASARLDRENFSIFELSNAGEAMRVINGETKKGAMVILASEQTIGIHEIVARFLASSRDRVFKLMVITRNTIENCGEGVETILPDQVLSGSLAESLKRIDDEKGGDRSIRSFSA